MATLPAGWKPAAAGLAGRTVLIVGATGGLGRASALACAEAGATVVLLGRKVPALEKLYDEIEALGAPAPAIYPLNLEGATPADYDELATVIAQQFGRLDGVLFNAGLLGTLSPFEHIQEQEWDEVMQVNVKSEFLLTQALLPLLLQSPDASIVFVEDDAARVRKSFWGAYGVAKAAQSGLAAILHDETENTSVRVASLLPPPMRTALRRMAYFGENTLDRPEPADFAAAVVYLLGRDGAAARGETLDLRSTH